MNDSVPLLGQNLERFQRSDLAPTPKKFSERLSPEATIGDHQWVIFCREHQRPTKLIDKIGNASALRAVLDDEASYATPNSK